MGKIIHDPTEDGEYRKKLGEISHAELTLIESILRQCTDKNVVGEKQGTNINSSFHYLLPDSNLHVYGCKEPSNPERLVNIFIAADNIDGLLESMGVNYFLGNANDHKYYGQPFLRTRYAYSTRENLPLGYIMNYDTGKSIYRIESTLVPEYQEITIHESTNERPYTLWVEGGRRVYEEHNDLCSAIIKEVMQSDKLPEKYRNEILKTFENLYKKLNIEREKAGLKRPTNKKLEEVLDPERISRGINTARLGDLQTNTTDIGEQG